MQDIRHLNLFGKVTRVSTRHCFNYNETIFFGVPKQLLSKAIGEKGKNVRKINETLGKKVKIIPIPRSVEDAKFFISKIVEPVEFKELEIKEDEIVLTAGGQSKAALLGRNKRRLAEMQKIVADFFKRDFRIV